MGTAGKAVADMAADTAADIAALDTAVGNLVRCPCQRN